VEHGSRLAKANSGSHAISGLEQLNRSRDDPSIIDIVDHNFHAIAS
jgi:hypothetical protein